MDLVQFLQNHFYGHEWWSIKEPIPPSLFFFLFYLGIPIAGLIAVFLNKLWSKARENYRTGKAIKLYGNVTGLILVVLFPIVLLFAIHGVGIYILDANQAAVVYRPTGIKGLLDDRRPEHFEPIRVTKGIAVPGITTPVSFRVVFASPFNKIKHFTAIPYELETPALKLDTKEGITESRMYVTMQVIVTDPVKYTTSLQNPNKAIKKASLIALNSITQTLTYDEVRRKSSEINRALTSMLESTEAEYGIKVLHAEYREIPQDCLLPCRLEALDRFF
jgi:regulator of protease activity HflC (stomatin/prohibitin superfamily)